jgi:predicted nucleic acid-binding protein
VSERVFLDTSVLMRSFADDDPPRALAAARLLDGDATLVVSTGVLLELIHSLRVQYGIDDPRIGLALLALLTRDNVELADADQAATVAAIRSTMRVAARRIPDAILAAAAERAGCDWIATFDERFTSSTVPVRTI